ncbi:MAG: hypothetical protein RLY20_2764, partial [Verrucomicrobiota bacterium]
MSQEDDNFSITDLRRKRDSVQAAQQSAPTGGQGGYGGYSSGHPPTNVGPAAPLPQRPVTPVRAATTEDEEEASDFHVDKWRVLAALQRKWTWILGAAVVLGLLGFIGGYVKGRYSVAVKFIRLSDAGSGKNGALSAEAAVSLLSSWDVARLVEAKSPVAVSAADIMAYLTVDGGQKTEIVTATLLGKQTNDLVTIASVYAEQAVDYTRQFQLVESKKDNQFYAEKAAKLEEEIRHAEAELEQFRKENNVVDPRAESEASLKQLTDLISQIKKKEWEKEISGIKVGVLQTQLAKQSPLAERLASLEVKLASELATKTQQHPEVIALRAEIDRLKQEISHAGTNFVASGNFASGQFANSLQSELVNLTASLSTLDKEIESLKHEREAVEQTVKKLPEMVWKYGILRADLSALEEERLRTGTALRAAVLQEKNSEGYFRLMRPVSLLDVDKRPRMKKATSFGSKGAAAGFFLAALLVLLLEYKERTIKTASEVEHVTGLRVLGALGDLDKMTKEEQERWAFRTWTIIAGQLSVSPSHGMVCGIVSSQHGEGRSTWIRLLGDAASRRGLRVLTVATKPSGKDESATEAETAAQEKSFTDAVAEAMDEADGMTP